MGRRINSQGLLDADEESPRKRSLLFKINGLSFTTPLVLRWGHHQSAGRGRGQRVAPVRSGSGCRRQISMARGQSPA